MGAQIRIALEKIGAAACSRSFMLIPAALGLFISLLNKRGVGDYWVPGALATVTFLGCCALVLYVYRL